MTDIANVNAVTPDFIDQLNQNFSAMDAALDALVDETRDVTHGGTGATSLNNNGVLVGKGTAAIAATAAGETGTLLAGQTDAEPVFRTGQQAAEETSLGYVAPTLAELKGLTSRPNEVLTRCRANPGDQGGGAWAFRAGDQSANIAKDPQSGLWAAPDSDPTGVSGAWERLFDGPPSARWWPVVGDGVTDDLAGLDAAKSAINLFALGQLLLPPGAYRITDTWVIGNGSDSAQSTTDHRLQIIGCGIGTGPQVSSTQTAGVTEIVYDGLVDTSAAVIEVAGPIHSVSVENLMLDANGKAGRGLIISNCMQGQFKRLVVLNWTTVAYELTTRAGYISGAAYGNTENLLMQCFSWDPENDTADGVWLTSGSLVSLLLGPDSCRNTLIGGTYVYGGAAGSKGIHVHGADNNTVVGTLFLPFGANTGGSSVFFEQWASSPAFPLENTFYNVAGSQPIGGTSGTLGNTFWPLPTSDSGSAPAAIANLVYLTSAELRAKQVIAHANGDGNGFEAHANGAIPILGLTRQSNGARLSAFDDIKMEAGATSGPGSGTNRVTIKTSTINVGSLPTSASGLSSGDLWNDSDTIKVVP